MAVRIDDRQPGTIFGLFVRREHLQSDALTKIECLQIVAGFGPGKYILREMWGVFIMRDLDAGTCHMRRVIGGEIVEMAKCEFAIGERIADANLLAKAVNPPAMYSEILCTWHDEMPSMADAVRDLAEEWDCPIDPRETLEEFYGEVPNG